MTSRQNSNNVGELPLSEFLPRHLFERNTSRTMKVLLFVLLFIGLALSVEHCADDDRVIIFEVSFSH